MKRRDFLKLIGVAPIAPSVLAAMPKKKATKVFSKELLEKAVETPLGSSVGYWTFTSTPTGHDYLYEMYCNAQYQPIGFAAKDIPIYKYGWVWTTSTVTYDSTTGTATSSHLSLINP